jgi:hypothetical protein
MWEVHLASTVDTAEERLRHRLRRHTERCIGRAIVAYTPVLIGHLQRSQQPDTVDSYISVLKNAGDVGAAIYGKDLLLYLQTLIALLTNIGADSEFRGGAQLLTLAEQVGTDLFNAGLHTTDLRLISARYSAAISNGGHRRRALIDRALVESRTADEKLRALLVLAKYHIDVSDYRSAHRYLDECDAVATHAPTGAAQRFDINTTRGMAYFYRDHMLATKFLLRGIALDKTATDPVICRASASALHFLGRIRATEGDYRSALAYLVLSQHYKDKMDKEAGQLGYHHLRLGQFLWIVGDTEAGEWHLDQAGQLFQTIRQRSTAEAQLNGTLAGIAAAKGDRHGAEYLLGRAIESARLDPYPRGELLFLTQLCIMLPRRGALFPAAHTALRGLRLWHKSEPGGWRWISQRARALMFLPVAKRRGRQHFEQGVTCPCPQHGNIPVADLMARVDVGESLVD